MDQIADRLLVRIRALEEELEAELTRRRDELRATLEQRTAGLERSLRDAQRKLRLGLYRFLREASPQTYLTAPFIYALIVPLGLLDLAITAYQWVCFPAYGIPRVRRGAYLALDRRPTFLNAIEKMNCQYCGYANGVLAYAREIASRTEQYWCPLKHARRVAGPHRRYYGFLDPHDAAGYRTRLEALREAVRTLGPEEDGA
jgi:hypothetical protein